MSKPKELSSTEKSIFEAIEKNDVSLLKTLLLDKQNINIVDENLMTPLQYAAYKGNKEMLQLLLDQVRLNKTRPRSDTKSVSNCREPM